MSHTYRYIVEVDTDYANPDAPNAQQIADELQSNLEFDAPKNGITGVRVWYRANLLTADNAASGKTTNDD